MPVTMRTDADFDRMARLDMRRYMEERPIKYRRSKGIHHGTIGGYTNRGCRCAECRGAKNEYECDLRARDLARRKAQVKNNLATIHAALETAARAGTAECFRALVAFGELQKRESELVEVWRR